MTDQATHLYRHFAADGELLYVGISFHALTRLRSHMQASDWSREIASVRIETFPSRSEALAAEAKAILEERPRYNRSGAPPSEWAPRHRRPATRRIRPSVPLPSPASVQELVRRTKADPEYTWDVFLELDEVARIIGEPEREVRNLISAGRLKHFRGVVTGPQLQQFLVQNEAASIPIIPR